MPEFVDPENPKYAPRPIDKEDYEEWRERRERAFAKLQERKDEVPSYRGLSILGELARQEHEAAGQLMGMYVEDKSTEIAEHFHVLDKGEKGIDGRDER